MGFGTSGSALIIFTGLFIAVGTFYTATANVSETINDATDEQRESHLAAQQTHVEIASATYNASGDDDFVVRINNTGETTLSVEYTDVIVDGTYVAVEEFERREVEGQSTDVWRPDEQLVLEDADTVAGFAEVPTRVKVVTETGIGDTAEVTN